MSDVSGRPDEAGSPKTGGRRTRTSDPLAGLTATPPEVVMLTPELPGIGGRIKQRPEDFVVTERPAYAPSGRGDHLYLFVEKQDVPHERMLDFIGRALALPRRDVATAGMKDRRAVTRQWVSVPARAESRLSNVDGNGLTVLDVSRHTNSLKAGHLKGNDFEITIRGVAADALRRGRAIIERINRHGCPNYFGSQRFGIDGSTLAIGRGLIDGSLDERDIPKPRRRFLVRLGLSALQSAIFNEVLAGRVRDGLAATVLKGDMMSFPGSRTVFLAEDLGREQPRLDSGETVITGPMIGVRMRRPEGDPGDREAAVFRSHGVRVGQFEKWRAVAPGTRRALTVKPQIDAVEAVSDEAGPALRLRLSLPAGAYATVVLNEVMKTEVPEDPPPAESR